MNRALYVAGLGLLAVLVFEAVPRHVADPMAADQQLATQRKGPEASPLCPWREPERDLKAWFPQATGHRTEIPVLSAHLMDLKQRLGRWPTPDENPLYLHRVLQGQTVIGTVLVRRVKGEYGAIEIVLAVDTSSKIRGVRLQRMREPEAIANALRAPGWLATFGGKTFAAKWQLGGVVPDVAPAARQSAAAVVEGVRSLLILEQVADQDEVVHHH